MSDDMIKNEAEFEKEAEAQKNNEQKQKESETVTEKSTVKHKKAKPILTQPQLKLRRKKRRKTAVAAFALLLAVGAVGNWYYQNSDISSTIEPLISSDDSKTLGEAEYVDAQVTTSAAQESAYFSNARVERQNSRDEALDKLQSVIDSSEAGNDAKKEAQENISKISQYITVENKIETLVTAKGIDNCLAVINSDGSKVDVIVDVDELSDDIIMQVKEIAMQQLGCGFEDISIIQSE